MVNLSENIPSIPSMTLRQLRRLTRLLNRKPSGTIRTLQILEPVNRDTRSTSSKLQKTRFLLSIPRPDTLPEVLDDLVVFGVASVVGVFLPVLDVDVCYSTDEEFEFSFVEDVDEVGWD